MSATQAQPVSPTAAALTGLLSAHTTLMTRIDERAGLTLVSSDPSSGTSPLLASIEQDRPAMLLVDARRAQDTHDLATAIADAAIAKWSPDAYGAWLQDDLVVHSAAGRALARNLGSVYLDLEGLQLGSGSALRLLRDAFQVVATLAPDGAVVALDHLGLLLAAQPKGDRDELIADLRSIWQERKGLDLLLVEHAGGRLTRALRGPNSPLFQAGEQVRVRRPSPDAFVSDLAVTRGWTQVDANLLRAAAELAAGVPQLTWRVVELAGNPSASGDPERQAFDGWLKLRELTGPSCAKEWDLLRRVHPYAQHAVAALSFSLPPFAKEVRRAPGGKTVRDALQRLREIGISWQPRPREWALADPLLAAWAREHAPVWVRQRDVRSSRP